jgi:hypothetical protein
MLKRFKVFVVPGEEGGWETWVSWVSRNGLSNKKAALRAAEELAQLYETQDILLFDEGRTARPAEDEKE